MGPVERPLDCSVADYGQLALWTGIIREVPGGALRPGEDYVLPQPLSGCLRANFERNMVQGSLRGLGMARHSRGGNGR